MNKLIDDLIKKGMGNFMDKSRDAFIWKDKNYMKARKDEDELSQRLESLGLTRGQKEAVNDYVDATSAVNHRYADISYMCGIKDTVSMLVSLGLIKGTEAE